MAQARDMVARAHGAALEYTRLLSRYVTGDSEAYVLETLGDAIFEQAMSPSNFSVPQFMAALVSQNVLTWTVAVLRGDRGKRVPPSSPSVDATLSDVLSWEAQANVLATVVGC